MERAEKAKSPEMETAGLPPNDMKRFYVNGRHLLREIAGLYVLIPAGETDAPQNRITALNETGRFCGCSFSTRARWQKPRLRQRRSTPGSRQKCCAA